ncbi:MAG: BatA domain-containing protein [Salibacteraceae bacterium]
MVFSSPSILWALGLLSIPIIIHLFQFRRYKKLYFSDVSLLKEIKAKSQTKNELKHLLILLSRLLILTAIIFAFARPIIPFGDQSKAVETQLVRIYIDNSFSMQAEGTQGALLNEATQLAYELSSEYSENMRFQLITNAFSAGEKRSLGFQDLLTRIDEVKIEPQHRSISEVLRFMMQNTNEKGGITHNFLISDFNSMLDSTAISVDSNERFTVLPLVGSKTPNLSIDSVWLDVPLTQVGLEQTVHFRVTNHGEQAVIDKKIDVIINDELVASPIITIEENTYIDSSFYFLATKKGIFSGRIEVEDSPIEFDNSLYFSLDVTQKLKVAAIYSELKESLTFERLFSSDRFSFTSFDQGSVIQDSLIRSNLLIFNSVTNFSSGFSALALDQLKNGNNVLLVLPEKLDESAKKSLSNTFGLAIGNLDTTSLNVNQIEYNNPLLSNVFEQQDKNINLPFVSSHYNLERNSFSDNILSFPNGSPFLASKTIESGKLYIITVPLKETQTNFQNHALFVPVLINMATTSGRSKPLEYPIETERIYSRHNKEGVVLKREKDSIVFYPGITYDGLLLNGQVTTAGVYSLYSSQQEETPIQSFSINYSRSESSIAPPSAAEIQKYFEGRQMDVALFQNLDSEFAGSISQANMNTELWPLFILFAALILILETILLKIFTR